MEIYIDLNDKIPQKAKRRRNAKYIKCGFKFAFYSYIASRLIFGGADAIVAYGKATVFYKSVDLLAHKIVGI